MEEMNLKEFKEKFMGKNSKWDFEKFSIICNKCNSKKIEFNGYIGSDDGYYGSCSAIGCIIVKCHDCGNAFNISGFYDLELNTDGYLKYD